MLGRFPDRRQLWKLGGVVGSASELEVDEGCHALGAERVGQHQRDRENGRLADDRQASESLHDRVRIRAGRYWEPIPTAMASRTPLVTSGEGWPQPVKRPVSMSVAVAKLSARKNTQATQTMLNVTRRA